MLNFMMPLLTFFYIRGTQTEGHLPNPVPHTGHLTQEKLHNSFCLSQFQSPVTHDMINRKWFVIRGPTRVYCCFGSFSVDKFVLFSLTLNCLYLLKNTNKRRIRNVHTCFFITFSTQTNLLRIEYVCEHYVKVSQCSYISYRRIRWGDEEGERITISFRYSQIDKIRKKSW